MKRVLSLLLLCILCINALPTYIHTSKGEDANGPKYFNENPESESDASFYVISSTKDCFSKDWMASVMDNAGVTEYGVTCFSNTESTDFDSVSFFIEGHGLGETTTWTPSLTVPMTVAFYVTYMVSNWDDIDPSNLPNFKMCDANDFRTLASASVTPVGGQWFTLMIYATIEAGESFKAFWGFDWTNMPPLKPAIYIDSWRVVTFDSEETLQQDPGDTHRSSAFGSGTVGFPYGGSGGMLSGNSISVAIYDIMGTGIPGMSVWYEGTKTLITRMPADVGVSSWYSQSYSSPWVLSNVYELILASKDMIYTATYAFLVVASPGSLYGQHYTWSSGIIHYVDTQQVVASWINKDEFNSIWGPGCLSFESGTVPEPSITTPSAGVFQKEISIADFGVSGNRFLLSGWGGLGSSGWLPISRYTKPRADYYISVTPSDQIGQQPASGQIDSSVSYQVKVTSKNGFNSPVDLTASFEPYPAHIGWSFDSDVVTPPPNGETTATLRINIYSDTPLKIYTFKVSGQSGALNHPSNNFVLSIGRILDVPYQGQGYTRWCAPSSLAMVLRYYGKEFHGWDYAEDMKLGTGEGVHGLKDLKDYLDKLSKEPEYSDITSELGTYYSPLNIPDYYLLSALVFAKIISDLAEGFPVILDLHSGNKNHAVVAAGYNETGLFVNDPSGALFKNSEFLNLLETNPKYPKSWVNAYVVWSDLQGFLIPVLPLLWRDCTLTIHGVPDNTGTYSTIYLNDPVSIVFREAEPYWQNDPYTALYLNQGLIWNYTEKLNGKSVHDNIIKKNCNTLYVNLEVSNCMPDDRSFTLQISILGSSVEPASITVGPVEGFKEVAANQYIIPDLDKKLNMGVQYHLRFDIFGSNGELVDSFISEPFYWIQGQHLTKNEKQHRLFLHVYDVQGNHVGLNYVTNQTELGIPGSYYWDDNNGTTIIVVPQIIGLRVIVDAKYAEEPVESYNLTVTMQTDSAILIQSYSGNISAMEKQSFLTRVSQNSLDLYLGAKVDVKPDTLNLGSIGVPVTAYIELPKIVGVRDINTTSILLNGTIPIDPSMPVAVGDCDNDGVPDLMVKFNRTQVSEFILSKGITAGNLTLSISGEVSNGTLFEGSGVIWIRMPGDANCDGRVDLKDVYIVAKAFGECEGRPKWDPLADLNEDGKVDLKDYYTVSKNYGKSW